jgi:anti-sigma-K factor RskA
MSTPNPPSGSADPGGSEPPSDDVLAGEYVLGVLDSAQHRGLEARLRSDRAFAERVAYWERRFAPWLDDIAPVEPPERVWQRVCGRLGWTDARASIWQSLTFWRGAAVVATLIAAVAVGLSVLRAPQPPTTLNPSVVTPLAHDDGTPAWLVSVDRARGTVAIVPVPGPRDPQGRVPELWLIPPGQAPRSLGLVSVDQSRTVAVPAELRASLASGSVLAVSLEQPSGIPHAAPAGPIIAKGAIRVAGAG